VNQKVIQAALEDIILQYTYPRLDAEVSKHRNHLLKAPFCIHPKTARVCVPVDPSKIDEFDPGSVPTVGELLAELDKAGDMEVDEEGGVRAGELGLYILNSFNGAENSCRLGENESAALRGDDGKACIGTDE
jgi:hypothetical protein